ncbi:MAG: ComF family protein, partial [Burkholderiaceae bacterium]
MRGTSFLRRGFARRCTVCALVPGDPICAPCERDFFDPTRHRCRRCALATGSNTGDLCGRCLTEPPSFDQTLALADYRAPIDGMVAALKFSARLSLAVFFGRLLARRETELSGPECVVVPVPLAFEREKERGFNQSHEIARVYARSTRLRLAPRML